MTTTDSNTGTALNACCAQAASALLVPIPIFNAPGLSAISYRIGTFTSFREAMLNSIALPDLMTTAVTVLTHDVQAGDTRISVLDTGPFPIAPNFQIKIGSEYMQVIDGAGTPIWTVVRGSPATLHSQGDTISLSPPNPFASWHLGTNNDYQTMFVELWAYLADILTFYQERIANEAYLDTATLRDSLLRLVGLIDYHPSPGAGASGLVAFTASKGSSLTVPAGFRVGSKPLPGQPAVVFETSSALAISGDNSSIPLSLLSPDVEYLPNTIVLQGINNRLAVDDYLLVVEDQGTATEAAHLLQLETVTTDKSSNTTKITWQQEIGGGPYNQASKSASVYALRVMAAPFGTNAPQWDTLSPTLTNSDGQHSNAPYQSSWEVQTISLLLQDQIQTKFARRSVGTSGPQSSFFQPGVSPPPGSLGDGISVNDFFFQPNPWFYVPTPNDPSNVLFLDTLYQQLNYTQQNLGWAILLTDGVFQILHVTDARQAAKVGYTLSAKVTRLTFVESVLSNVFPLRNTIVLTGGELLPLQIYLPLPDPVSDEDIFLKGAYTQLQDGQTVVIKGNLFDTQTGQATSTITAEYGVLHGTPVTDPVNNVSLITLKNPLANSYARATTAVLANIVEVTQGETVKDEVLGSSDGSAFQSFPLKKKPLTYLPSTDPEGLSAVKSTLNVIVNGVAWNEQPNLAQSAPNAQDFTATLDNSGQTTVVFGDALNGARPASGVNNIHARYRKGLGSSGNLSGGAIQQLIDSVPNLQKVTNPLPSSGGGDPDAPSQIRVAGPASLRTFGRAVSAADYAALALNFPGIAKATSTWILSDPVTLQAVAHPYIQLTVATVDEISIQGSLLARNLRRYLDNHRDPNVRLRLQDFNPVYIEVAVQVEIDSHFPLQRTLSLVQAALNPGANPDRTFGYFAFQNLQFGQTIFVSAVYAVAQNVPGIQDATITSLRRVGPTLPDPPGTVHDIVVGPTEIAVIGTPGAGQGQLTVAGKGGFSDT
jgi:hypothetical protein